LKKSTKPFNIYEASHDNGDEEEVRPSKKPRDDNTGSSLTAGGGGRNNENLMFSPLSIYAVLVVVAAGARDVTPDELLTVLDTRSRDELVEFTLSVITR
jgi:hypothetical protein